MVLLALLQIFEGAIQPQPAIGPGGKAYVAMIQGGDVRVAASEDGGKTWGTPATAIDTGGKLKGGMRRGPRIGVDAKGGIVVTAPACFDEAEFKKQYPSNELWLVRSADGGKTWSKPVRINEEPKKAAEALHWMAVDAEGIAHVAWLDFRDDKINCLWYTRVKGEKPEKNRKLTGAVCECCAPGMALDAKGNPFIVVRERSERDRGVLLLVSRNGGKSFEKAAPVQDAETNVDT